MSNQQNYQEYITNKVVTTDIYVSKDGKCVKLACTSGKYNKDSKTCVESPVCKNGNFDLQLNKCVSNTQPTCPNGYISGKLDNGGYGCLQQPK